MLLEEEVPSLLRLGFISVMGTVIIFVVCLMVKCRKSGYGWILAHLILFSWCAWGSIQLLETRATASSMYNSLIFAWIGAIWAISMICMVVGLLLLRHNQKNDVHVNSK